MIVMPQVFVVGGCGRRVGKTAFACAVIERFGVQHGITAVKITTIDGSNANHHPERADAGLVSGGDLAGARYRISDQTDLHGDKDTARMLACGARRALWLQVADAHLPEGIAALLTTLDHETVSIWESTRARRYVEPGAFIMVEDAHTVARKPWAQELSRCADRIVSFDGVGFDMPWSEVQFARGRWTLRRDQHQE